MKLIQPEGKEKMIRFFRIVDNSFYIVVTYASMFSLFQLRSCLVLVTSQLPFFLNLRKYTVKLRCSLPPSSTLYKDEILPFLFSHCFHVLLFIFLSFRTLQRNGSFPQKRFPLAGEVYPTVVSCALRLGTYLLWWTNFSVNIQYMLKFILSFTLVSN